MQTPRVYIVTPQPAGAPIEVRANTAQEARNKAAETAQLLGEDPKPYKKGTIYKRPKK